MLTADYVHLIRVSGKSDGHWARLLEVTRGAVRAARTGTTWPDHPTPPDRRPRKHGRRSEFAVLCPEPEPTLNVGRLIAGMPAPSSDDSGGPRI